MKIQQHLTIILTTVIMLSCNEEFVKYTDKQEAEIFSWENISKETNIKGELKKISNSKNPDGILVIPSKKMLIVSESEGDYLCSAYSLDSLKYIKSFIKKGEGPEDQLVAFILKYNEESNCLEVTDSPKRSIYSYSVDSIGNLNASVHPISIVKISANRIERAIKLKTGNIVDVASNKSETDICRLTFFDSSGNFQKSIGKMPLLAGGFRPYEQDELFMSTLTELPDDSSILITCFSADIIEKYDYRGNLLKRLHGPDGFNPESKRVKKGRLEYLAYSENARAAYSVARANQKHILISYNGGLQNEAKAPNIIFLFESDLSSKQVYRIDIPIGNFDIDWERRTIYGISSRKPGNIITYNF